MKLCLDEDEESRPECLTLNYFSQLMASEAKKKGVFQLLSFKRKRDRVYSTKISDGFFEVKVMMVQDAAKQLQREQIKAYSILSGWMRNHGEGVVVVKQSLRYWSFSREVGRPVHWRLKKQNVNVHGSSFIVWQSQQLVSLHATEEKVRDLSLIKEANSKQKQNQIKEELFDKEKEADLQNGETKSLEGIAATQSLGQIEKGKNRQGDSSKTKREANQEQLIKKMIVSNEQEQQTLELKQDEQNTSSYPKESKKLSSRMQSIMSFLFDSDEDSLKPQIKSQMPSKQSKRQTEKTNFPQKQEKIDLRFIYNALCQQEQSQKLNLPEEKEQQAKVEANDEDDEVFMEWLSQKRKGKQQNKRVSTQMRQSVNKRRQEMYRHLMSSSDSDSGDKNLSKKNSDKLNTNNIVQQAIESAPQNTLLAGLLEIKLQNVYNGIFPHKSIVWWTYAIIRCLGQPTSKDYINGIVADQSNERLISVVFLNVSSLSLVLQQGKLYRMGKGIIRSSADHNSYNSSNGELQFDCSSCLIEKVEVEEDFSKENSANYNRINKIYQKQDGEIVHVFGVIKNIKNIATQRGFISTYQIVDPIIKYSISMVQFDSHLPTEQISELINAAITVYYAIVGSYKGRKNLVSRHKTIIKHNWLPITQEANEVRVWLQGQNCQIQKVDLNLVGFTLCPNLRWIACLPDPQLYIKNVTVLDISPKFTYLACTRCLKKVQDDRCRTCGKRSANEISERLFVRGNIGDGTTVMNVLWANSVAESILVEGFAAFEKRWVLKKVSVWLEKGNKDSLTIVKIKESDVGERVSELFSFIKGRLL